MEQVSASLQGWETLSAGRASCQRSGEELYYVTNALVQEGTGTWNRQAERRPSMRASRHPLRIPSPAYPTIT